ncbi:transposase [Burkholderia sp. MSMB1498]|nr:transposase [Burkholderia sp. MSMB1498]
MFAAARSDSSFRTPPSLVIPDISGPLAGSRAASRANARSGTRHSVRAR